MTPRIPPQNLEMERLVLGAVLNDSGALDRLSDLSVEAFYSGVHRAVYASAVKLHQKRQPVDLYTVSTALGDRLEALGGMTALIDISDSSISAVNLEAYAEKIKTCYQRRQLIATLNTALEAAYDPSLPLDDLQTQLESGLTSALTDSKPGGLKHISEILPALWEQMEKGKTNANPTGLKYLDQCLDGGFRPGELILIAARPSMGKSFVGAYAARRLAESAPVALFSLEMDALQIVRRMVAAEGGLLQSALNSNRLAPEQVDTFFSAYSALESLPIYVDDTPGSGLTINRLVSECHRVYRKHGSLGLVVVDYLQLIGDQGAANRVGQLGQYSSALKSLAKELGCPVVALSQLSREVEKRNDKRPVMSDIRDSGCLEQDADVIIFLYRDEYYNQNSPDQGVLELIIRKNRSGPTGTAKANFDTATGVISNYTDF